MNEHIFRRDQVRDANPFIARNTNLSHRFMKMQRDGEARLEPSGPVARVMAKRAAREAEERARQAEEDEMRRRALGVVRQGVFGSWDGITPQQFRESVDILRMAGFTDEQILSAPVYEIFSPISSEEHPFNP